MNEYYCPCPVKVEFQVPAWAYYMDDLYGALWFFLMAVLFFFILKRTNKWLAKHGQKKLFTFDENIYKGEDTKESYER